MIFAEITVDHIGNIFSKYHKSLSTLMIVKFVVILKIFNFDELFRK